ncbi:hypothetical protein OE766_23830 [Pararhizobium sp. YC-54]|uniref:hypothetical protein n=1 Tax=Pararhizobium sp. YC-54 TaxID=2986920 RepID=UPI0021F6A448|nr:hypothetical protein [Pararhizobium sp. YC-54]MCW0001256.1 hypothetical protein [Pararhizobium sp. YC-54]
MAPPSLVARLLSSADDLLELKGRSAAYRRRAVSTAYYAVFHALAKLCAEALLPDAKRDDDTYSRIYRALDHGPLKNTFLQSPLKDHPVIKVFGPIVVLLQTERHRADYSPPDKDMFALSEVEELIRQAKFVVGELDRLNKVDRRLLATSLLFKERKS